MSEGRHIDKMLEFITQKREILPAFEPSFEFWKNWIKGKLIDLPIDQEDY